MSKRTRNILLGISVVIAVALLGLRIVGQLNSASGGLGMFSELLGYEGERNYAVIYVEGTREPTLLLVSVIDGKLTLRSAAPLDSRGKNLPVTDFALFADKLAEHLISYKTISSIDAVGLIESSAAEKLTDAFGGLYLHKKLVQGADLSSLVGTLISSPEEISNMNSGLSFRATNLFTHGKALLSAAREAFSKKQTAVYFRGRSPFREPCLGACGSEALASIHQ